MISSLWYYVPTRNGTESGCSVVLDGPAKQLGDERQPEGDVHLASLGRLGVGQQRVIVVGDLVEGLGLRPQVLGPPDALFIRILEQPSQGLGGHWRPGQGAHP